MKCILVYWQTPRVSLFPNLINYQQCIHSGGNYFAQGGAICVALSVIGVFYLPVFKILHIPFIRETGLYDFGVVFNSGIIKASR